MSMTAVPISMRLVRAPTAASSGKGEPSCRAKWCTRKYAPSAPSSSAATARSIDCSNASDADRVCEPDVLIQQLKEDEAIAAADTLLLTVPNQLGVDYNAHVIEAILKHVAPVLGWR